jgi:hypothetical protein
MLAMLANKPDQQATRTVEGPDLFATFKVQTGGVLTAS